MPSTITATLRKSFGSECSEYANFVIQGQGYLELDSIFIEYKAPRKHRDKACWSVFSHYKARSIGHWLDRLQDLGFDTSEFEQACIELGWENEVKEYHKSKEKGKDV